MNALNLVSKGNRRSAPPLSIAVEASELKLSHHFLVCKALQEIVCNCLQQIHANETAVAQGNGMESLHQMRVGLRRLCSAFKLFEAWISPPPDLHLALKELLMQLGAGRDWEVLHDSTLAALAKTAPAFAGLDQLLLAVQDKCVALKSTTATVVGSQECRQLLSNIAHWNQSCGADLAKSAPSIDKVADRILWHRQKILLKRGHKLHTLTPQARHRLRIAAKKMRYATEFFQSLYAPRRIKPFLRKLKALQEELGYLNDLAVAGQLLQQLQSEQTGLDATIRAVQQQLEQQMQERAPQLGRLWRKFSDTAAPSRSRHRRFKA